MPRKPLSLMNCQTCGGRSRWTCVVSQSVTIAQSSSTSWSRKRCSSAVSVGDGVASSCCQSGRPEKSSPSHQTVPASIASRSVCDIGGSTLRNAASTRVADELAPQRRHVERDREQHERRASAASVSQPGSVCATHATPSATAMAAVNDGARGVDVGQRERAGENGDEPEDGQHRRLLREAGDVRWRSAVTSARRRGAAVRVAAASASRAAAIAVRRAGTARAAAAAPRRCRSPPGVSSAISCSASVPASVYDSAPMMKCRRQDSSFFGSSGSARPNAALKRAIITAYWSERNWRMNGAGSA